jgi:SAM-dependent methyltransferase
MRYLAKKIYYRLMRLSTRVGQNKFSNTEYWSRHNVTDHRSFETRKASLEYLDWRNTQYTNYSDLMPLSGHNGSRVLDYGCGPGHDMVGFLEFSKPSRLVGMDISRQALLEAENRLALHPGTCKPEFIPVEDRSSILPFEDGMFDYIHSSGVLHHTPNLEEILQEFRRILAPGGRIRVMVYHRESLWYHLYVAYVRRISRKIDTEISMDDAFRRSTDGPNCPISRCYRPEEFLAIGASAGLTGRFLGAAISLIELGLHHQYHIEALQNVNLPVEHRSFLRSLTYDNQGIPSSGGVVAGIDAVYEFTST